MIRVEASSDGLNWVLYAKKPNMELARQAAMNCIGKTKHTQVRILE